MTKNSFMIFYYKFYKRILDAEFPALSSREKVAMAGRLWSYIPNTLKNEFKRYYEIDTILTGNNDIENKNFLNYDDEFQLTYDKHCYKVPIKDEIDKMFEEFIDKDAYEH